MDLWNDTMGMLQQSLIRYKNNSIPLGSVHLLLILKSYMILLSWFVLQNLLHSFRATILIPALPTSRKVQIGPFKAVDLYSTSATPIRSVEVIITNLLKDAAHQRFITVH